MWLAEKGWHVTAVDVSETALARAAAEARSRGVLDRIDFQRHDLSDSFPDGSFDLASAQFLHSTVRLERARHPAQGCTRGEPGRPAGHRRPRLGAAVLEEGAARPSIPSAEEVLAELDLPAAEWVRVRVEVVERDATDPDGQPFTWHDNLMVLQRQ